MPWHSIALHCSRLHLMCMYLVHLLGCCHGVPRDAGKVLVHALLGRRQVAHLGAQALRDGQMEAACLLHLHTVQEGLPCLLCPHSALHHRIRSSNARILAVDTESDTTADRLVRLTALDSCSSHAELSSQRLRFELFLWEPKVVATPPADVTGRLGKFAGNKLP